MIVSHSSKVKGIELLQNYAENYIIPTMCQDVPGAGRERTFLILNIVDAMLTSFLVSVQYGFIQEKAI
jgi:hypothetical protein